MLIYGSDVAGTGSLILDATICKENHSQSRFATRCYYMGIRVRNDKLDKI